MRATIIFKFTLLRRLYTYPELHLRMNGVIMQMTIKYSYITSGRSLFRNSLTGKENLCKMFQEGITEIRVL